MRKDETGEVVVIRREGVRKGVYLLPNLCTITSLFCGFFSIIKSLQGEFVAAGWAILIAGVFDFLDGRIARLTHAESDFGVELDSLVDLASFGLAPGVLVYTWALSDFDRVGWLVTFLFFACGALRLARFNVQVDNVEKSWFQGLPIPLAAYSIASSVIFYHHVFGNAFPERNYIMLVATCVLALLMVSTIPYRSFKQVDFKNKRSFFALVAMVGIFFVVAAEPQIAIFVLCVGYVMFGLIEEAITLRTGKAALEKYLKWRESSKDDDDKDDKGDHLTYIKGGKL